MWIVCFFLSVAVVLISAVMTPVLNGLSVTKNHKLNLFRVMFAGVFLATLLLFVPVHSTFSDGSFLGGWRTFLLSVFNSIQVFAAGCEFAVIKDSMVESSTWFRIVYQAWAATLFVLAPVFTFSFVLSLFKNLTAFAKYLRAYFRDAYVFSQLNSKSLALASDVRKKHPNAVIVFTDVFEENNEEIYELIEGAKGIGAILFKKDILVLKFGKHSKTKDIYFFTISEDETENLNHTLKLIELYRHRENTHIYAFSTKVESELLLTAVDKGCVKVRRINEVQSLVNRLLYERGEFVFESANPSVDGTKVISAVVVGMGRHGTEMVKALCWFAQMDGYTLKIHAFDKDPLAKEKFSALAPELMSEKYNGVKVEGEAQYSITIHSGFDVETMSFSEEIAGIPDATYVFVALGNDGINISTAVNLRMYFERMKIHPVINTVVYNSRQKNALCGIKNYRGQEYDIEFIGDTESSYTTDVIIDSELEEDALKIHLKWGQEEEFWSYEYNYRSSMASAIHKRARKVCGILGADKKEEDLTAEERDVIESLEHRRWNAYMRAEGYVYSGSKDKKSRNDLAKMHHDLVEFSQLSEGEKRKDSAAATD